MRVQRTRVLLPAVARRSQLTRGPLGSTRKAGAIVLAAILGSCCRSSGVGSLQVNVVGQAGDSLTRIPVMAGSAQVESGSDGVATFEQLGPGDYQIDARAPGMRSCGPVVASVRSGRRTRATLLMRLGAVHDYVLITGPTAPPPDQQVTFALVFQPCPGNPGSALVVRTFASGKTTESPS